MDFLAQNLSWPRLSRLMLTEVLFQYKKVLQGTAALTIIAFFIALALTVDSESAESLHNVFVFIMLLTGGAIFTSMIFNDMHHPLERFHYLILPCSNLEKFLSKFLLTGPLFILYAALISEVVLLLSRLVSALWVDVELVFYGVSNAPWEFVVVTLMGCLFAHALLFFGAIYFSKHALLKTVIGCFLLWLSTFLMFLLCIKVFYWSEFPSLFSLQPGRPVLNNTGDFLGDWLPDNGWFLILVWAALYLWVLFISYTRLKEHEV